MTEKAIDALKATAQRDLIATYRYLAFLHAEMRALVHEIKPKHRPGDMVQFPLDVQVNNLVYHFPPSGRAVKVLLRLWEWTRTPRTIGLTPSASNPRTCRSPGR